MANKTSNAVNGSITLLTLVAHINKITSTNWSKPVKAKMINRPNTEFKIVGIDSEGDEVYVVLGDKIKKTAGSI